MYVLLDGRRRIHEWAGRRRLPCLQISVEDAFSGKRLQLEKFDLEPKGDNGTANANTTLAIVILLFVYQW